MFLAASTLAPLPQAKLERLRLSLNNPVVAIENLPVGPAAAGIALHRAPGGPRITVAVRSVRSDRVIFFHPDEEWSESEGEEFALEAALSFAESMGFLFDDDMLETGAEVSEAAACWAGFLEESELEEEREGEGEFEDDYADEDEVLLETEADEEEVLLESEADEDEVLLEPEAGGAAEEELFPGSEADASSGAEGDAGVPDASLDPSILSKFRFLSSIPADRLLAPPPTDGPARNDSVLHLLSRF